MLVFDALIFNTDRHYGNFGFLVDSHSKYNLSRERLALVEYAVQQRAIVLLEK